MAQTGKLNYPFFLDELSSRSRAVVSDGLNLLRGLQDAQVNTLVGLVVRAMSGESLSPKVVAAEIGTPEDDAASLMSMAMTITPATMSDFSAEQITSTLAKQGVEADQSVVNRLLRQLKIRSAEIERIARLRSTTDAVLPSFRSIEVAVDVRLRFDGDQVIFTAPVLVAQLRTDASAERLWFQISRQELDSLIRQLQEASKQLAIAEQWSAAGRSTVQP